MQATNHQCRNEGVVVGIVRYKRIIFTFSVIRWYRGGCGRDSGNPDKMPTKTAQKRPPVITPEAKPYTTMTLTKSSHRCKYSHNPAIFRISLRISFLHPTRASTSSGRNAHRRTFFPRGKGFSTLTSVTRSTATESTCRLIIVSCTSRMRSRHLSLYSFIYMVSPFTCSLM